MWAAMQREASNPFLPFVWVHAKIYVYKSYTRCYVRIMQKRKLHCNIFLHAFPEIFRTLSLLYIMNRNIKINNVAETNKISYVRLGYVRLDSVQELASRDLSVYSQIVHLPCENFSHGAISLNDMSQYQKKKKRIDAAIA